LPEIDTAPYLLPEEGRFSEEIGTAPENDADRGVLDQEIDTAPIDHAFGPDFHEEIDTASIKNSGKAGFREKSEGFDTAYELDTRGVEKDDTNPHPPFLESRRPQQVTAIGTAPLLGEADEPGVTSIRHRHVQVV